MSNNIGPLNSFKLEYAHPQNSHYMIERNIEPIYGNQTNNQTTATQKKSFISRLLNSLNLFETIRNFLIFRPCKKIHIPPKDITNNENISHEEVYINTPDGERLQGYFLKAKQNTDKVVIYLHGNDLNVSRWILAPIHLQKEVDVNFLIVDYRGYGKSTGSPTQEGVIIDALSMYNHLLEKGYKPENISIYGRSLGGAVALELANRVKVRSVVVQSSFSSRRDIMKHHYPFFPSFLVKNNYFNSKENVKKINAPILISHGTEDELVPLSQAHELYQNANEPKKLITLEGAGHKHLKKYYTQEYFETLRNMFVGLPLKVLTPDIMISK